MAIRIMGTRPLDMDTVIPPRRSGTDMDTGIRQRRSHIRLRSSSGAEWFTAPRYTAIGLLFDALTVSGQPRFTALRGRASIGRNVPPADGLWRAASLSPRCAFTE